jgi:hypothetical protein
MPIPCDARGGETVTFASAVAIKANRPRDRDAYTRVPLFPRSLSPRFVARLFKYLACYIVCVAEAIGLDVRRARRAMMKTISDLSTRR